MLEHCIVFGMPKDLTSEIKAEIQRVLERFGVEFLLRGKQAPEGVNVLKINLEDVHQVNRLLEQRGADIYLLCTIGSWRDTATDEETLRDLREWNEKGAVALQPEVSFASTDKVA